MSDPTGFRQERIEKLLHELRYEITRGMMEGEIDENIGYRFMVPLSKAIPDGVVWCEFRTRPIPRDHVPFTQEIYEPRLRVIQGGKE